jgi:hypothetical protein
MAGPAVLIVSSPNSELEPAILDYAGRIESVEITACLNDAGHQVSQDLRETLTSRSENCDIRATAKWRNYATTFTLAITPTPRP